MTPPPDYKAAQPEATQKPSIPAEFKTEAEGEAYMHGYFDGENNLTRKDWFPCDICGKRLPTLDGVAKHKRYCERAEANQKPVAEGEVTRIAEFFEKHGQVSIADVQTLIQAATAQQPTAVIADWMIKNGYATGHGDTVDDLLDELVQQQGAPPPVTPDEARRALTLKSFGYAEGHYYHQNCVNCQQSFEADKRALSCKSCAEKLLKSAAGEK